MQEWELFRVWDSAEVEHTEEDETEHHFTHNAELTSEQTGVMMYLGQNEKMPSIAIAQCKKIKAYDHLKDL